MANSFSEEPINEEIEKGSIYSCILRQFNNVFSYDYDSNYYKDSWLYFVSLVIYNLVNNHYLKNGNKRISISVAITLLSFS